MVREDPLWQDGNDYPARLDRQFIEDVFDTEGVIRTTAPGALAVSQRAAGANMSVDVAAGRAVIKGDDEANQGCYRVIATATENLPIGAAPGSNSRIDLVVARVRDANVVGGVSSDWVLEVIPGVVAAAPVAPAVPNTAIPLAQVLVATGTASITAGMITDRRATAGSAAYQAVNTAVLLAGTKIHVPAAQMKDTYGTPTLAGIGSGGDKSHVAWLLDAANPENLTGQIVVPAGWATVDIALWWTNAGAGAGDVKFHLITHNAGNGATLGTGSVSTSPGASQAPLVNVAKLDLLAAGLAVTPGNSFGFRLQRDAGNGADTLANDCGVLALEIRRMT